MLIIVLVIAAVTVIANSLKLRMHNMNIQINLLLLLSFSIASSAWADVLDLPNDPLILTKSATHNMFLTLDNSRSMKSKWGGASIPSNQHNWLKLKVPETNSLAYNSLTNYLKWVGVKADSTDFYPDIIDLTQVQDMINGGWGEGKMDSSTTDYTRKDLSWSSRLRVYGTTTYLDALPTMEDANLVIGDRYRETSPYIQNFHIITQTVAGMDARNMDAGLDWIPNPPPNLTQNFYFVSKDIGGLIIDANDNFTFNDVGLIPVSAITCEAWTYDASIPYFETVQNSDGYWVPTENILYTPEKSRRYCYIDFSTQPNVFVTVNETLSPLDTIYRTHTREFEGEQYPYDFYVWNDINSNGELDSISEAVLYIIAPNTVFPSGRSWEEELRNYAYWEIYNSTRIKVAKASLSQLLDSMEHSDAIHIEYGVLNDFTGDNERSVQMSDLSLNDNESLLLKNLFNTRHDGETPLREKVADIGESLISNPSQVYFRDEANGDAGGSCTKNYNIVISDGAWSDNSNFILIGNTDGDNDSNYDGGVYADNWSNTLADVAMHYYETDLQPALSDEVIATPENPAIHQHLTNHLIGFNLSGNIVDSDDLEAGVNWPSPYVGNIDTARVDDIRHAAFNSRGGYYSANNIDDLTAALAAITGSIQSEVSSLSPISVSTTNLDTSTRLFLANFESDKWTGNLSAFELQSTQTGEVNQVALFNAGTVLTVRNIANSPRNLITYNATLETGVSFEKANLDQGWLNDLGFTQVPLTGIETIALVDDRIDWIKGDLTLASNNNGALADHESFDLVIGGVTISVTKPFLENLIAQLEISLAASESSFGFAFADCPVAPADNSPSINLYCNNVEKKIIAEAGLALYGQEAFRERNSRLGDIIHSNPVYVAAPTSRSVDPTYLAFKTTYSNRAPMVYIGANDGMLHAFDAATGEEKFAYLPKILVSDNNEEGYHYLTQPDYNHRYYVDGSLTVSDVKINGVWRTILVGALRSGGKGYFALDITDPSTFADPSQASSRVLWEFTNDDYSELGFSFSRARIFEANDGKWHIGFGNGVNAANGVASLVLLNIAAGMDGDWSGTGDYVVLNTPDSNTNGLFTPTFIDTDSDGTVDFAYAGDINGALWKFDLSSNSTASWAVSLKLFNTSSGDSITTAPSLSIVRGQLMVFVGGGRFITELDRINAGDSQRYFYGFIDNDTYVDGATDLLEQTVDANFPGQSVLTNHAIDFDSGQMGWKLKLEDNGEMNVTRSILRDGIVFFNSFSPTPSSCGGLGYGYKYAAKMSNGGQPSNAVFDINGDDQVDLIDNATNANGDTGIVSKVKVDGYLPEPVFIGDVQYDNLNHQKVVALKNIKTGVIYWIELK